MRFTLLALALTGTLLADDYPQWLGPRRDGLYREPGILEKMPPGGLKVRWRAPIGGGYAGAAVWNGKIFVTDRQVEDAPRSGRRGAAAGVERLLCLSDKDGSLLWKVEYDCLYTISYAAGPRCTPAVDTAAGRVYTLGAEGHLYCVDARDGKVIWNLKLAGPTPTWGFAGHPLIDGNRLIVLTSGKSALVTAFDKETGKVLWESEPVSPPGYVPPRLVTLGQKSQLLAWSPRGLFSFEPDTGRKLWFVPHGPVKYGAACTFPAIVGDRILMTSEYEGASGATIDPSGLSATKTWQKSRAGGEPVSLHNLMSPLVVHDGMVFGVSQAKLTCVSPIDGRILWQAGEPIGDAGKSYYAAFITPWQPDEKSPPKHFFLANDHGDLILCFLSAKGYNEIGRAHLLDPTNRDAGRPVLWCHPAYANRSIYWRNDKEIVSWSLAAE